MRPFIVVVLALSLLPTGFASAGEKIRLVILDGQNNHDWRATTPILREALEASGRFDVDVSTWLSPKDKKGLPPGWKAVPFPPDLERYQVVLSNYNGAPWPEAFRKALEDRGRSGRLGLVVFHAANNAFKDWEQFNRMIGMGWRNNQFGDRLYFDQDGKAVREPRGKGKGAGETSTHPFPVTIRDRRHPITRDLPAEWMHTADQLVHGLRGPIEEVHVLATAYSDPKKRGTGEHEPMLWTVRYGKGRVCHTPMGHNTTSVRCVGFLTCLLRGAEWAASGETTLPVPKDFPTAKETSSRGK